MCGRTAQGLAPAQIRRQLENTLPSKPAESWIGEDKYRTSYNVAPTRYQPVVRADSKTNSYVVHLMRWGLIPRHTKAMPDYGSVLKSINARDDSLFMGPTGKPMFSHSKNHKRCILLAEGFYEWRRRGKDPVPFYTKRRDGKLMLMAAIYDVAQIQGADEPLYTYATITTNASPQLDWLHDRMPVLISNNNHEGIRMWLDPNMSWNSKLEAMLKPCDEFMQIEDPDQGGLESVYALETYQVDEKVNSVRNDSPDFAKPWNSSSNKKTLDRFFTSTAIKREANHKGNEDGQAEICPPEDPEQRSALDDTCEKHVSVLADDSKNDAGFNNQLAEDKELELALELSRQDQYQHQDDSEQSAVSSSDTTPQGSTAPSENQFNARADRQVTVDLLEKRRKELQNEDEEMKRVLEISRLQAIADGHEDIDAQCHTPSQQSRKFEEQARKELEELEKAIAASLNETDAPPEQHYSQQSSTSSTSATSATVPSPGSKRTTSTSTPRKRKPSTSTSASPVNASKNRKTDQDSKITSFFQHAAPS